MEPETQEQKAERYRATLEAEARDHQDRLKREHLLEVKRLELRQSELDTSLRVKVIEQDTRLKHDRDVLRLIGFCSFFAAVVLSLGILSCADYQRNYLRTVKPVEVPHYVWPQ